MRKKLIIAILWMLLDIMSAHAQLIPGGGPNGGFPSGVVQPQGGGTGKNNGSNTITLTGGSISFAVPTGDLVTHSNIGLSADGTALQNFIAGDGDYATAMGVGSAQNLTNANHVTAYGAYSCNGFSTSSHNTCLGIDTLRYETDTSTENTVVGEQAENFGSSATQGAGTVNYATAVGANAGQYNGAYYGTFVGYFSGPNESTSPTTSSVGWLTGIGAYACGALEGTNTDDTCLGAYSGQGQGTGFTAVGSHAGYGNASSSTWTAIGANVGNTTLATNSILIGVDNNTQTYSTSSQYAIAIGQNAKAGGEDIFIGRGEGTATSGDNHFNTGLGSLGGYHISSGSSITILGAQIGQTSLSTASDVIIISNGGNTSCDTNTSHIFMVCADSGSTPIIETTGTGTPSTSTTTIEGGLDLPNIANAAGNEILCFDTSGGPVTYENAVAGCVPSALRFKKPEAQIVPSEAQKSIETLRPAVWRYKDEAKWGSRPYVGLYADDVARMDARCVDYDKSGKLENYEDRCVIAYLVATVQAQQKQISALQARQH